MYRNTNLKLDLQTIRRMFILILTKDGKPWVVTCENQTDMPQATSK